MNTNTKHTIDNALLKSVFMIQNPSNNRWCNDRTMDIIRGLAPKGCTVVRNRGNMLIRKGPAEGPHPYYLAHMDQVHDYEPGMSLKITGDTLSALDGNRKQTGVGGDDKCGIYLALAMLHSLDHCTAVFVRDEETGCYGSGEVPLEWFKHAAFVIQADRNNRTMDVIRSTNGMLCASDEFMDALLAMPTAVKHGHKPAEGSVTDIGELASRDLAISMVNISSGYHNPHCSNETVRLSELEIACTLALEAGLILGKEFWEHVPTSSWVRSVRSASTSGSFFNKAKTTDTITPKYWGDDDFGAAFDSKCIQYDDKEWLIEELTSLGYDRELHNLDIMTTDDLEYLLEELETNLAFEEEISPAK